MYELGLWKAERICKLRYFLFVILIVVLSVTVFIAYKEDNTLVVKEYSVSEQKEFDFGVFPYVLKPADDMEAPTIKDVQTWIGANKQELEEKLYRHGAVLFRGFPVNSAQHFDMFVKTFGYQVHRYEGGSALRSWVYGNVFTSNDAPSEKIISYHHEMAFSLNDWPRKIFLYCQVPAQSGGETPIVPSHEVYVQMQRRVPHFVEKLDKLGLIYVKSLPPEDDHNVSFLRSWKNSMNVQTKEEAERACRETDLNCEWSGDDLITKSKHPVPAIQEDARNGKKLWFNAILGVTANANSTRSMLKKKTVMYGTGESIEPDFLRIMKHITEMNAVQIKWQVGDVLMVDNRQVMHARNSFGPPREIYVVLTEN